MSLDKTPVTESHLSDSSSAANGETLTMPVCPSCGMKLAHGTIKCPNDGTEVVTKYKSGDCLSEKYQFLESVGSGGMGIIYKANHLALNRIVAIKLLHPYLLNADTILRFQREARTASKLRHPNLIEVQDVGSTDEGQPYMVMDFISGKSLSDLIREKGRLTVEETIRIFIQICNGLAFAHKQNILHRDLKPSNVMLVSDEHGATVAKILDFGIAKVLEEGENKGATLTKTGDVFGSPLYMSPEQGAGGNVDRRSDLYSLGCMLFECLTGTPPFVGKSIIDTLMGHAQQRPPSLKEATLGSDFPEELNYLVLKLLAKAPDDRYQSVVEVRENLQAILDSLAHTDAVDSVSKSELRKKAGSNGTVSDGSKNFWVAASGKDLTILLLSLAVIVLVGKDIWVSYREQKDRTLPTVEADNKYKVNFESFANDTSNEVQRTLDLHPSADSFELRGVDIDDSSLAVLKNNRQIQKLDLESTGLKGTGLAVCQTLPNLEKLNVSANPLTDEGVLVISQLRQVKNLEIKGITLSPLAMSYIGKMKNLTKLELDEDDLQDKNLAYLSNMPALEELSLNDQKKMSDRNLLVLRNLPALRMLDISGTKATGKGLVHPNEYPHLEKVSLTDNKLSEEGFRALGKLKNLQELDLRRSTFDANWLKFLKTCPRLNRLKVAGEVDMGTIERLLPSVKINPE